MASDGDYGTVSPACPGNLRSSEPLPRIAPPPADWQGSRCEWSTPTGRLPPVVERRAPGATRDASGAMLGAGDANRPGRGIRVEVFPANATCPRGCSNSINLAAKAHFASVESMSQYERASPWTTAKLRRIPRPRFDRGVGLRRLARPTIRRQVHEGPRLPRHPVNPIYTACWARGCYTPCHIDRWTGRSFAY